MPFLNFAEENMKSKTTINTDAPENIKMPKIAVIPKPATIVEKEGKFIIDSKTIILSDKVMLKEAMLFATLISPALGFDIPVKKLSSSSKTDNAIIFKKDKSLKDLGDEGYQLEITPQNITAEAYKPAGVFYAAQTLRQLLPIEIFASSPVNDIEWSLPCLSIKDKPQFAWRGHLFDCCRHFFTVETVKRSIDLLALHKMNVLHWHLTEDQGWRIEIKKYPKLTEIGAWRLEKDGSKYGGFYTQEQIKDIVAYAEARHVLVVPEIEMPGHSTAALASYPEYGCAGGPYTVINKWGVFKDVYCAGNDKTFKFLKDVLDEVMDLFPSPYIHIGGDECPKSAWKECPKCQARIKSEKLKNEDELQSYFIKRIEKYLNKKGKIIIGWDEILEGGLAPNAIVQSWRGVKGGIHAANENHEVIMSPTSHCYLDYGYVSTTVEKAFLYNPIPEELSKDKANLIKGIEGNIWTEHVPNQDRLDFQVYPRICGLAEAAWTAEENRDWLEIQGRLIKHTERLKTLGVKYGFNDLEQYIKDSEYFAEWNASQMKENGVELQWDITKFVKTPALYSITFLYKSGSAALQIERASLLEDGKEIASDEHQGWSGADKRDIAYKFKVEKVNPDVKYTIKAFCIPQGSLNSNGELRIKIIK